VSYPAPFGPLTDRERGVVERARSAAAVAAEHASRHDREATFPIEGLAELTANGYLALVVPHVLGGGGASVTEMLLGNLELAKGDASLGLVVAMHSALLGRVRDAGLWPAALFERVGRSVVESGALINSLASEPEMGSPSRGGLPATTAVRRGSGWHLNGRKTFSSGSTVLGWAVVSAAVQSESTESYLGNFLVPTSAQGIRIEPTWDSLGMRATCSHTVVFEDVSVGLGSEVPRPVAGESIPHERGWSLTVAAVYLGVAEAARDFAVAFARDRRPTALGGKSIASLPNIRDRVGRMDLLLFGARGMLVSSARAWDAAPSAAMDGAFAATKVVASNNAIAVCEEAMRLVGGSSLDRSLPLERHYRDVRGGLHHPPQDDAAIAMFARQALDEGKD
jgi:alkylation response protein AidB-like acyl-CoA dehydrogenase